MARFFSQWPGFFRNGVLLKHKKPRTNHRTGFLGINAWQCPTFAWDDPILSSALSSFTSEFEMDSGGSTRYCRQARRFVLWRCA
jgi:hypothetical protein